MELNTQKMEDFKGRHKYFLGFLAIAFVILFVRLWSLQVIRGAEYRRMSENNRVRIRETPADRGMLLDRKGRILAHNRPCFEAQLIPEDLKGNPDVLTRLRELLKMTPEEVQQKLKPAKWRPPFKAVKIKNDIQWEELALLESNRVDLPGVLVDVRSTRAYNYGDLAAHLIGYIGEIDESELKMAKTPPYRMGAAIGKYGIEYQWEDMLRGVDGGRQIEVDAVGREIKPLRTVEPSPGNNLSLTVDLDTQLVLEEAFRDKNGVCIAMDPHTGHILAMLSKPSFDPAIFAGNVSAEAWKSLVTNPDHPLQNKGLQGQYPPGSVFKIVTSIAGLESKIITPASQFTCTGAYHYGNRDFRCFKREGHGTIDLHSAIVQSCDSYFYQLGVKLGPDRIAQYASQLGLGRKTGIPLPHERPGILPSSSWKLKQLGAPWYSGETLSYAVGQGYMTATPIQIVEMMAAVANGGKLLLPQVVEKVSDLSGKVLNEFPPVETGRANISTETLQFIREALRGVVNDPRGTGGGAAIKGIEVSGKTGTAQVVRMAYDFRRGDMNRMPAKLRDHAWFAAFAPFDDPQIAVVVLVEHGGFGGAVAAPIAKKVIETYLKGPAQPPITAANQSGEER
jgi:penicillin-binding protein 2